METVKNSLSDTPGYTVTSREQSPIDKKLFLRPSDAATTTGPPS